MTTINCSSNCVHQKDGQCTLENVAANHVSSVSDCLFFEDKAEKSNCEWPVASPV